MSTAARTSAVADRTLAQEFAALLLHIPLALFGGILSYFIGQILLRFVSFAVNLDIHRFPSFFTDIYSPLF
jgi:hypothetical protein